MFVWSKTVEIDDEANKAFASVKVGNFMILEVVMKSVIIIIKIFIYLYIQ